MGKDHISGGLSQNARPNLASIVSSYAACFVWECPDLGASPYM